jgi:replicative DNA helicase
MEIKKIGSYINSARRDLYNIQTGKTKLLKTGRPSIDSTLGGLLPGDIVVVAGASGHGKSTELYKIKNNILDVNINPEAQDYVFLDLSLEMKVFNIVLRGLDNILQKSKKEILTSEFTADEIEVVKKYFKDIDDDRHYISQKPTTPDDFYNGVKKFAEEHRAKKAIVVSIDHILLVKGQDKQKVLMSTIEHINQLKLEFDNIYFIVLSQLNRGILDRIYERNRISQPNTSDLYMSESMLQAASYVVVVHNPFKLGINEYSLVNPKHYSYLSNHFGQMKNDKVSFQTFGRIFYHVLKIREGGVVYDDIFIEEIDLPKKYEQKTERTSINLTMETPENAFGDDDFPF